MHRRPVLMAAISMLSAVSITLYEAAYLYAVPFLLLPFIFYRRGGSRAILLSIAVFASFALGLFSSSRALSSYEKAKAAIANGSEVTLYGRLLRKELTDYGTRLTVGLRGQPQLKVMAYSDSDKLPLGSSLKIRGSAESPDPARNPGCFDEAGYYRSVSVAAVIYDAFITPTGQKAGPLSYLYYLVAESLWKLKYRIQDVYSAALPGEEGPLLGSLVIGTKSLLDPEVKDMFTEAGISHILAISGLHISIFGAFIFAVLMKLFSSLKLSVLLSSLLVFFYSVTISDSVSCRRALIMYLIIMAGRLAADHVDILTSLSAACIFLCVSDPLSISHIAFRLSFSAVALLAITAIPATDCYRSFCVLRWENVHKRVKGNRYKSSALHDLVSSLIFCFFIQISMAAINAHSFYSFPLLSALLNVILLPLLPFVLAAGLLGGIVGSFFFPLGKLLLFPCHYLLYFYELASSSYNSLPFTDIVTGALPAAKVALCLALCLALSLVLASARSDLFRKRFTRLPWKKVPLFPPFGSKKAFFSTSALLLSIIALLSFPNHRNETAMLDVGQGDGILITTSDGRAFMIDGGSTSENDIAGKVILPSLKYRGIARIEGWFITHLDEDHSGGLFSLLEKGYPIGFVWVSKYIEPDEKLAALQSLCKERQVPLRYLDSGDALSCSYFRMEAIFPDSRAGFSGVNENSLVTVLRIHSGNGRTLKLIETGDIGEEQEKYILAHHLRKLKKGSPKESLILKAAHHGSNYSNCSEWLGSLSPDLILVSAGEDNRYGHPGAKTMERIEALDLPWLSTIDSGQIRIIDGEVTTALSP